MLTLLVGTGVWFTLILGFPQVRYFGLMLREVIGRIKNKNGDLVEKRTLDLETNQNTDNPSAPILVKPERPKKGVVYNETSH